MSRTTALAVTPNRRPVVLAEYHNGHGWSPSIWKRLLEHNGKEVNWYLNDTGLNWLWRSIEDLPAWQQIPLVLTFDTGVVPFKMFQWAADRLEEFELRLPAPEGHANHVPAVIELLRTQPETPLFGVYGTSVSENPFDPWDEENDQPGSGIPLYPTAGTGMYVLERHRHLLPPRDKAA